MILSRFQSCAAFVLTGLAVALSGPAAFAQADGLRISFDFTGRVDCDQPLKVNNFPFSGRGSGVLYGNRKASLDMSITGTSTNTMRFDASLGGRPTEAPGGTAQLRVAGSNRLRMIWSLPNNEFTVDITASKAGCKAAINTRLKGGSRQYSLFDGGRFLFCAKPRITQTSCNIR
jgi:hypothetical protein